MSLATWGRGEPRFGSEMGCEGNLEGIESRFVGQARAGRWGQPLKTHFSKQIWTQIRKDGAGL